MEDTIKNEDTPLLIKAKTTVRRTKKALSTTKLEEPLKRERGRPKKTSEEKGGYNHVLFKTNLFKPANLTESAPLTDEQRQQRTVTYLAKIREIVHHDTANEYYWRLVFTATFHLYRSRKQMAAMAAGATKIPSILPSDMAEDAGMEYFNLKNLFSGRGTAKNVFCFLRFLYEQSIDFNQVQYNENIIDRAYTFLTVLRQDGIDPEEVKRLFYK
jgi:hypothetical protein